MVNFREAESAADDDGTSFVADATVEQRDSAFVGASSTRSSQHLGSQWASPPEPINQILDAPATPAVLISPDNHWLVEFEQPALTTIAGTGRTDRCGSRRSAQSETELPCSSPHLPGNASANNFNGYP